MLQELYCNEIASKLKGDFRYSNEMQIPKITKVCVNAGISKLDADSKYVDYVASSIAAITGQCPVKTFAKKSISNFKLRKGDVIGCKVTLRRKMMYYFMERLIYIALPREKDFKGFSIKQFDKNGNLSFGIKEHTIFPEINYDMANKIFGMDITIATNTIDDEVAKSLLSYFGFPFINKTIQ